MRKLGYPALLLLVLAGTAAGQASWDLGSTQDWLSAGPILPTSAYYYPYHYTPPSGFAQFFTYDYSWPYYYPPYWYSVSPGPYYMEFRVRPSPDAWWVGSHRDLEKVLSYARTQSSFRIYYGGAWQPP